MVNFPNNYKTMKTTLQEEAHALNPHHPDSPAHEYWNRGFKICATSDYVKREIILAQIEVLEEICPATKSVQRTFILYKIQELKNKLGSA